MAIELLKELDPKKVEAWDRVHDKRKLYRCERCGAEWKCEYHENKFGKSHEMNGDPDILCQCCGGIDDGDVVRGHRLTDTEARNMLMREIDNALTLGEKAAESIGPIDEVKYFCCGINVHLFIDMYHHYTKGSLWFEDKKAGKLTAISDSETEFHVVRLVFALETEFNWLYIHQLGEFNFKIEFNKECDEIQLKLWKKE